MKKIFNKKLSVLLSLLLVTTITTQATLGQGIVKGAEPTNTDNLKMNKSVEPNDDGSYTITLDAFATGEVNVISKSKPNDVVMVLDVSGSMRDGVNYKENWIKIIADSDPRYGQDYDNSADYYYIYDEVKDIYVQLFRTNEFQFASKYGYGNENHYYQVFAYQDKDGNKYVPAKADGTSFVSKYQMGDTEKFKTYPAEFFYKIRNIEYSGPKKMDILKQSVINFINEAAKDGVNHRISLVSFSEGARIETDFLDVTKDKEKLIGIVNSLKTETATNPGLGMEKALEVINNNALANDTKRNHATILFTDGMPDVAYQPKELIANNAIAAANKMKAKGYTVYTAGISSLLNNEINPSSLDKYSDSGLMNLYMQYTSSNFPNAFSIDNAGVGNHRDGKFLYATDEESFKKMFEQIRDEISTTNSTLDENTELIDYVSDEFYLDASSVQVYTQAYQGNNVWGELVPYTGAEVAINEHDQSVIVKGYNYKENFVVESAEQGMRLVVKLTVNPSEGFIGGNKVATNKEASGIFHDNQVVKNFNQPIVNVPINYTGKDSDTSIYVMSDFQNASELVDVDLSTDGIQYIYKKNNKDLVYSLDGKKNKYVNISYLVKSEDGAIIGQGEIPAGARDIVWHKLPDTSSITQNTKLYIETSVSPITEAAQGDQVVANTRVLFNQASVNVFKPVLGVVNDYAFAGETIDVEKAIREITWACTSNPSAKLPNKDAPTLQYTFENNGVKVKEAAAYVIEKETDFTIKTASGAIDISKYTTINNKQKPKDGDFRIHTLFGELNITKTIDKPFTANESINSNQTFIFNITRRDADTNEIIETFDHTIDFDQNDIDQNITSKTITLKGLKKGVYEVKEDTNWSWKYDFISSKTNYKDSSDCLLIGEKLKDYLYFGTETGTVVNEQNVENPGKVIIKNSLDAALNIIGDCANAINMFTK